MLGQEVENYKKTLDTELNKYNLKNYAIQDKLLKENISEAFNYVIFSNSDLVSNSSAFGYTQNKEKTNVSISANLRLGSKLSPLYARVGANASGSKNLFEFYSDNSWSNNVSLNLGLILKVGKSSSFFKGNEKEFNLVHAKRRINASEQLFKSNKYTSSIIKDIINLKKDIFDIDRKKHLISSYSDLLNEMPDVKKMIKEKKYEEAYTMLDAEEKKIQEYLEALKTKNKLQKYIENNILYEFDKKNDITYGYSLKWFDLNLNLGNSTYNFTAENIDANILDDFSNSFNLSDNLNKLKSVLLFNFNHAHNAKETIWYYQIGVSVSSSSFLENALINGTPKIVQDSNFEYILEDDDEQNLGRFNSIKENFKTGSFNIYSAIFFTKKKNFGFNLAVSHNYLIDRPKGVFFNNNFTTLFGPIFRKVKDDQTSLTFGIDMGWENAIYKTKVTNDFTGRIRVGIPFNIYTKKKTEKKP
ncbi:hypothetical protein [Yeosuana marina]|uniref:hypothetical protein n=1 Tax=Yeosuana marina TaxID=1565536 RepID=UPI0014216D33|nr:hypothetical protein [Yeosuana marina]